MLAKAAEYLQHANDALAMIPRETDDETRRMFLHMAETWLKLAEAAAEEASGMRAEPVEPEPAEATTPREERSFAPG